MTRFNTTKARILKLAGQLMEPSIFLKNLFYIYLIYMKRYQVV